ncbi:MAG: hypothetical protein KDE26_31345, partial [Bacteroidetes bacterium]|nr:hypothetical protein [Bacteroidota bacterium]
TSYSETQVDLDHFLCEDDIELLRGDEPPITLWELSGQDGENPVGELLVDSSVNSDEFVIMLFWDQSQEMKETCFSKPGEVAGETQIAIRIFAITPEDAIRITKFYEKDEEEKDILPEIALPRFGYMKKDEIPADFQTLSEQSGDGIYLHAIEDFDTFFQTYNKNCALGIEDPAGVGDIIRAYDEVSSRFSELFFGENTEPFKGLQDYLTRLLDQVSQGKSRIGMQYFYDYLKDLVLAYLEFVNSDFADTLWNNPDKCLFPYHNLLGLLKKNITTYDFEVTEDYRTHLIRPPVAGLVNDDLNHARDLFQRMMVLAGSEGKKLFKVPGLDLENGNHSLPEEIKITPSKGKLFPLSDRAIPYY